MKTNARGNIKTELPEFRVFWRDGLGYEFSAPYKAEDADVAVVDCLGEDSNRRITKVERV